MQNGQDFNLPSDAVEGRITRGKAGKKKRGSMLHCGLLSSMTVRQLLLDIEDNGGLDTVSVKAICDRRPELFGEPSTDLRRSVQNQVTRWKTRYSTEGYDLLVQRALYHHPNTSEDDTDDSQQLPQADLPVSPHHLPASPTTLVRFATLPSTTMMSRPGTVLSAEQLYIQDVLKDQSRYGKSSSLTAQMSAEDFSRRCSTFYTS